MRPHRKIMPLLCLLFFFAGAARESNSGAKQVSLLVEVETLENARDGSVRSGCRDQREVTARAPGRWWIAFGNVLPDTEGLLDVTAGPTYCGPGSFQQAVENAGRTLGTPRLLVDLRTTPARKKGKLEVEVFVRLQELTSFSPKGRPIYAERTERRVLLLDQRGEVILPLFLPEGAEAEALGLHEVLLRVAVRVAVRAPVTYGAVAVSADVPNAEILLDGGPVGRTLEDGPFEIAHVPVGSREIRVRDYSGREATAKVQVKEGRTAIARLLVLVPRPSAAQDGLVALDANPQGGQEYWRVKDGALVVRIPAGEFLRGSSEERAPEDEHPQRSIHVSEFFIDKTEVTWRQLRKFSKATGEPLPKDPLWGTPDDFPASGVNFELASGYCSWAGGRLPTEAEWEKAARGTDGRKHIWGERWIPGRCNCWEGGPHRPGGAGSYPECLSPYGVLDLPGSMWEWTADWYGGDYYEASPARDPRGPEEGKQRVVRGGAWLNQANWLRPAYRHKAVPSSLYVNQGFRCAQDVPEEVVR